MYTVLINIPFICLTIVNMWFISLLIEFVQCIFNIIWHLLHIWGITKGFRSGKPSLYFLFRSNFARAKSGLLEG